MTPKDKARFEAKFHVTPGCWTWMAFRRKGYGRFRLGTGCENANRVSYALYVGQIPDGMLVCHRCDNPSCVNPDHLFLGTNQDNISDMDSKGRRHVSRGTKHGMAKLSDAEVLEIKKAPGKQRDIAKKFGISQAMVNNIKLNKNWKHLNPNERQP